jgi:hypothetical protein
MKIALYMTLLALLATACGASKPVAERESAQAEEVEEAGGRDSFLSKDKPLNWATKPFLDKQFYMKQTVVPAMGELFLPMHPDFQCSTCHGETYQEVKFKMPNTLKPLDPANMPFQSADEKMRNAAQFMMTKVVPRMAGLLERSPYDPETKTGFGCFNCHATKPAI